MLLLQNDARLFPIKVGGGRQNCVQVLQDPSEHERIHVHSYYLQLR